MQTNTQQPRPAVIAAFHHRLMLESESSLPPGWAYFPVQRLTRPEPRAGKCECPKEPDGRRLRKHADNEYRSEPAQESVVGTTLLIAASAGVGLLFAALGTYWLAELGAFVCGVVGRMLGK